VRKILALAVSLALFAARDAHANPWDLYGFNPRALSMASSHTAFADDFTAVYYNPAALTAARSAGFGFGFMASRPNLSLNFDNANRSIRDLSPPHADGVTFGTLFPLGGRAVRNRIAMGFALNVPTRSLLNGQALDPATPHWYMFQSLPSRLVAVLGLGAMPVDWLSLGVGVQFLAGVTGSLDYALDVVAGRFTKKTVLFDIKPSAAPLFGLELRPLKGLRVGASYRSSIQTSVSLPVDLDITGISKLTVMSSFIVQYSPHQFSFGASYDWAEYALKISADATYALWSKAPDPSPSTSIDVGGDLFTGTGLGQAFNAPAPGQERNVDLAFRNTLTPRAGVEKMIGPLAIRAGYALRPSPSPLQTSGTNYVDATTHQIALGAGYAFRDPFDALANPLVIDVGGALFIVANRRYDKIDPNDPVGSYSASGNIIVLGVSLRYAFEEATQESPKSEEPSPVTPPKTDEPPEGDADSP
jgi:long-subunit fatty acid transport protein